MDRDRAPPTLALRQVNIDSQDVSTQVHAAKDKLVSMQNGCICCTLREDLLKEIAAIAKAGQVDYILIESTGISEPMPVAETFTFGDLETGEKLGDVAYLDNMVTVVDCARFFENFESLETLQESKENGAATEEDERTIVDLMMDQVEFADTMILNKTDLVSESDLATIRALLHKLNPTASQITSTFSKVPLTEVIGTGRFNMEHAMTRPGWLQELR